MLYVYYIPLVLLSIVFGVAAPRSDVPDNGLYYYYYANNWQCEQRSDYWPMLWDDTGLRGEPGPECEGHNLLVLNEPELSGQSNVSPVAGAELVNLWADWDGPLWCCGNQHSDDGWLWFGEFIRRYESSYGTPPPLAGIHLHAYSGGRYATAELERWRTLADENGWQIAVTEFGPWPFGRTSEQIAGELPAMRGQVIDALHPSYLFWFAWHVLPGDDWEHMSLYDGDGRITPVGSAWYGLMQGN